MSRLSGRVSLLTEEQRSCAERAMQLSLEFTGDMSGFGHALELACATPGSQSF